MGTGHVDAWRRDSAAHNHVRSRLIEGVVAFVTLLVMGIVASSCTGDRAIGPHPPFSGPHFSIKYCPDGDPVCEESLRPLTNTERNELIALIEANVNEDAYPYCPVLKDKIFEYLQMAISGVGLLMYDYEDIYPGDYHPEPSDRYYEDIHLQSINVPRYQQAHTLGHEAAHSLGWGTTQERDHEAEAAINGCWTE